MTAGLAAERAADAADPPVSAAAPDKADRADDAPPETLAVLDVLGVLDDLDVCVSAVDKPHDAHPTRLLYANRAYRSQFGDTPEGHVRMASQADAAEACIDLPGREGLVFEVRARDITWTDGTPARILAAHDLTARRRDEALTRQLQAQVQHASRLTAIGETASALSHELNQPLAAIVSYAGGTRDRVLSGTLAPPELARALEKIVAQARRAGAVVKRIRDFVRRRDPRLRPVALASMVADVAEILQPQSAASGIGVGFGVDADLAPVFVDRLLIEQVLLNLAQNAIDAMGTVAPTDAAPARIEIAAGRGRDTDFALVSVSDRGPGLSAAMRARLFEPFLSTKPDGLGLGLSLCRSIVEAHGSRLEIADRPGGGTVARFSLPFAPVRPATEPSPAARTRHP